MAFILLILVSQSAILAAGQTDCTIKPNTAISAGGNELPWLSPYEEFAFGFRPLQHSASNDKNLFLLSIWFNKIPEQTIVWSKNDNPVPKRSTIHLTNEGQLILRDHRDVELWRAEIGNQKSSCAAMLDSGNFVLMNANSALIWDTFNVPTDTILPSQRLKKGRNLTSRQSDADYSDGRFQLRMQDDGNLVLYTIFLPTQVANGDYWSSRTTTSPNELVFDESGYLYIQAEGGHNIYNLTGRNINMESRQDFYFLARLDQDGVFRQYHRPRGNYATVGSCPSSWSVVQTTPDDICRAILDYVGSGACGYNSYCVNSNGKPSCFCPQGYSLLDPLNLFGGCKPDFPLPSCHQNGWENDPDLVDFKELNDTDFPLSDYEMQTGADVNKESCKQLCLIDCFCAAAIYNGDRCWKKRFPLSNGKQSRDVNRTALIKVPRDNARTSSYPARKDRSTVVILLSALLGSSVFLNFLLLAAIAVATFLVYHKKMLNLKLKPSNSSVYGIMRVYSYKELEEASGGFKENLGRGSFGTVYKGYISNRYVAIKRLDRVEKQGEKEFATEVMAIGQTHHKNLVTLLGYCDEGSHRLLVYEYMCNGSLASHLFGLSRPRWHHRMQIALGIARGLAYLHDECTSQIIHCDVKPHNILLDEHLVPKISDFGMAKLLLSEQSRAARTHIRGTVGYFAPEWFRKASVSTKVDVYSFGVMLLEMICCSSSVGFVVKDEDEALIDWVYECYNKKMVDRLVENDEEGRNEMESVERVVMVGIWCIQEDPCLRPSMRRVAQMLEGVTLVSVPPRPSLFTSS